MIVIGLNLISDLIGSERPKDWTFNQAADEWSSEIPYERV